MPKPKPALLPYTADRCETLKGIAGLSRWGALNPLCEDLAAWVASVEVVDGLKRAGFAVARSATTSAPDATPWALCACRTP